MTREQGTRLLERYDRLDGLLVAHGFPPTSPWWRAELAKFLRSGRRRWVLRVGRRGGKSSTMCRLMVAVALWGEWSVPPGDTGTIAVVSVDRLEASKRIHTVRAILDAIGISYEQRGMELFIPERRCSVMVKTCSLTGTVGFTSVMLFSDEMAKWSVAETGANPAKEVMASLRPSMATQPAAFEVDCSAPWGLEDLHAELMSQGDSEHQVTAQAATWEANPTITEEQTRELEPDPKEWARAYAAVPSETVTGDWFGSALDVSLGMPRCVEPVLPWVRYMVSIDPAFERDHFGWAVTSCRTLEADPRLPERPLRMVRVHEAGAWKVDGARPVEMAYRLREEVCKKYHVGSVLEPDGTAWVITDQFEGQSFSDLARQAGIVLQVVPWTAGNSERTQIARYRSVRLAMLQGGLQLPPDSGLESELRQVGSRLLPSGNESILLPRGRKDGHLDRVSALVAGASELLLRTPQPEEYPQPMRDEGAIIRAAEERKIMDKRRRELEQDPNRAMRRALLRGVN